MAAQFEVYEDSRGSFRWHLMSDNGEVIASCPSGQPFKTREAAKRGIRAVQAEAHGATVVDATTPPAVKKAPARAQITPAELK